ncbi:syntaxin-binding protein 6 isoform X1 [Ranitomeya variabilis]|uniref:syntaxin-binding protein 6 isoform X1 n=1 Tax=Ranitomeya variabilis TaxID=490064 RepID=UPI0040578554
MHTLWAGIRTRSRSLLFLVPRSFSPHTLPVLQPQLAARSLLDTRTLIGCSKSRGRAPVLQQQTEAGQCSAELSAARDRRAAESGTQALQLGLPGAQLSAALPPAARVTNKKPSQVYITKVKQFEGSSCFVRRSQWTLEQLRQVNGIDPNRESPEFDLQFDNASDQWVASSGSEKFTFFQILHHTCQRYLSDRKPEFINCQSRLFSGNSILHSAADSVTSAVQKASQALNERGERLGRAEESTAEMMNSAQQFADTAHKLAMKHKC